MKMFQPEVIVIVQGSPEWNALYQAMGQYVENTGEYVEDCEEPDIQGETDLKHAQAILGRMECASARLADIDGPECIPERIG